MKNIIGNFITGVMSAFSSIAIVIISLAIIAAILFTINMETGGASGIPLFLALFLGLPLLGIFWILLKMFSSDKKGLMNCTKCDSTTKVNWGDSNSVLCKSCSIKS